MKKYWMLMIGIIVVPILLTACNRSPNFQHKPTNVQLGTINTGNLQEVAQAPPPVSKTTPITDADQAAITQAILSYLKNKSAVSPDDVKVLVEKKSGNYARVSIEPLKPVIDSSTAFLKYNAGQWTVISVGTAFDLNFYLKNDIPADLQFKKTTP